MALMDGKVALVTGGGRGIGREVCLSLAAEGARVVVADLGGSLAGDATGENPAQAVVDEIAAKGGEAVANTDSVSEPEGAARMVQAGLDAFGRLDAVVNIAGILRDAMFHKMTHREWHAVMDVHLHGSFCVSHAAMPHFREQASGAFVHFTSTSGLNGNIGQANYAAAKMGLVGLSRVLALEGARYSIRSNCVAPFAWTRMIEAIPVKSEEQAEAFRKFREGATPAHVAPVVTYLVSEAAAQVSGQVFGVRGNEIYLMSQPRPLRTLHRGDGWTPERLRAMLVPALKNDLLPLDDTDQYYDWDPI